MLKTKEKKDIVILGAGLAGLSTAYHLERGYSLFEKEPEAGGMARSINKDGYIFDYDGHLLHFRNEYALSLVKELLGGNLAPHRRNSWIYSKGRFTQYPFQANFYGLPKDVIRDCLLGLVKSRIRSSDRIISSANFRDWIGNTFGEGIAKHFMLPYNKKFWTIDPSDLTCEWLDGFVPVPTIEDVITGAISSNTKSYGYNSRFWYPVKGGISGLVEGFLQKVSNIYLGKRAVTIDQYRREIVFEDGTIKRFKQLVSTVPMPELFNLLVNIPSRVKEAFSMLKFTSIFVVNLGIMRDDLTDKHWVYYPEDKIVFYRAGFPTNFSMDVAPAKRTSIYAEISYSGRKELDKEKAIAETINNLKILGMIENESEIELCLPVDIKYGYIVYDVNRSHAVDTIKGYLKRFGLYPIGRYGGWRYMSMEDVILDGKEIAEVLRNGFKQ